MNRTSTSTSTSEGVVKAAMSIARDAAEGKLDPARLDERLADELGRLFSDVVGQDDSLWPLQLDVARQVIALGGVPADELNEWAAALRHRDAEPSSEPQPYDDAPEAVSSLSVDLIAQDDDPLDADANVETQPAAAEPGSSAEDGCDCASTGPATITLADGRSVPAHRVAARGRDLPTVY